MIPKSVLDIEGKNYALILDLNAMCKFEEITGKSAFTLGADMHATDIRALFWAALQREQPEMTLEEVGKILHAGNISEISEKITTLFNESMPEGEDDEGEISRPIG